MSERVLVLHGVWNTRSWLLPLVWRLRRQGFDARAFGYSSIFGQPQAAVQALIERVRGQGTTHLVGYSLGGLIALEALRQTADLPVPTLVCVGSPLCGSHTAQVLAQRGLGRMLGGSAGMLQAGQAAWQGGTRIGQVAGCCPRGIGCLLHAQGRDSDGTVGLAETRWPGLADHSVVDASHTGLAFSAAAAAQVGCFLRHGHFAAGQGKAGPHTAGQGDQVESPPCS